MKILYLDTSSSYLYTAILEDTKILSEIKKEYGQNLSKESLPEIAKLFENTNINPKDIKKIIVVNGPGSFTGIRIGLTIAKVYAWTLNIDIITVSSLEAMSISCDNKTYHIPMINARRGYVFAAIYNKDGKEIYKQSHIKLEELDKEIKKLDDYIIITNDLFEDYNKTINYNPNISKIVEQTMNRKPTNPHAVNPEYLKLTEAEESKLNDNRI